MFFSGIQSFQFSKILAPLPNHINIPAPNNLRYKMLEKITNESCQVLWIDIQSLKNTNMIGGVNS